MCILDIDHMTQCASQLSSLKQKHGQKTVIVDWIARILFNCDVSALHLSAAWFIFL